MRPARVDTWAAHEPDLEGRIATLEGGGVPFLVDWGASPHPSATAAPGLTLVDSSIDRPEPGRAVCRPEIRQSHTCLHRLSRRL